MRSDPALKKWYNAINAKFFLGQLPDDVCVRWALRKEAKSFPRWYGYCERLRDDDFSYVIVLFRKHNKPLSGRLATLAHEMIHVATHTRDDHGPVFERWRARLARRGLFKKGALLKDVTLF
jgi:hypothetical protein